MRLIDADALDKMLMDAQAVSKEKGGNFRCGVIGSVRENIRVMPTIELPKEQQPRLLTLCEVSNAKYPEDVFCEIKDENRVFAVTAPVPIQWRAQPDIRYWTARPTEEQRKAEPWKDGEQE